MTHFDNRPPADELFAVRAQIKELTAREVALRDLMLADPSARTGNVYIVEIRDVTTKRTDLNEMRKMYPDVVEQFTFPSTNQRVELRGVSDDGEITSLRRKTA